VFHRKRKREESQFTFNKLDFVKEAESQRVAFSTPIQTGAAGYSSEIEGKIVTLWL
jgi:hypothetical protein